MEVLAIDIGGTSVKHSTASVAAISDGPSVQLHGVRRRQLPSLRFTDLRDVVRSVVAERTTYGIAAIGISTSGSVDQRGRVVSAGHFEGYSNIIWRNELEIDQGLPVVVVNDGRAAAWGEYSMMSPKAETHVHVVLGTGVGGGIVHRSELLMGDSGQAGYIGHIRVTDRETVVCSCGRQGHVESLASERGICNIFAEEGSGDYPLRMSPSTLEEVLKSSQTQTTALTTTLYRAGAGLGAGLGAVLNVLNPGAITIGGGVVIALTSAVESDGNVPSETFMQGVMESMAATAHRRPFAAVECCWGRLANDAGIVGAALLAASAARQA